MAGAPKDKSPESGEPLHVEGAPPEAENINVEGRHTQSPREGFGQMWRKTYRIALDGVQVTPEEVADVWKRNFPKFQPPENRVYPTGFGIVEGEVILIDADTPGGPVSTGVQVIDVDARSFTLATPQGHPEAGRVSFSTSDRGDGTVVAQVQSVARASDPLYELAFRVKGSEVQERIWKHVLTSLAKHFGVAGEVDFNKVMVDPRLQWSKALNVRHNAMIGTMLHRLTAPVRWLFGKRGKG